MIFGDHVEAPSSAEPAEWISGTCRGPWGTVGAIVPNRYSLILRVHGPQPTAENWWAAYRDVFATVASIGERHTSTPTWAWFAVWEGHGFDARRTHVAWRGPLDGAAREALEQERSRLRKEDDQTTAGIQAGLREVPRFALPHRAYYLLTGPVAAASLVHDPGTMGDWRRPDLFWPDDRTWFVATDVDFWSLYIGGDHDFISELASHVPTPSEIVRLDDQLEAED